MPDSDWPPLQRLIARFLRTLMYAFATVAAAGVIVHPPIGGVYPWAVTLAAAGTLSGAVAAVGSAAHRWHLEWAAAWVVGGAFAGYAILEAVSGDRGTAAALAVGASGCWARAVDLWVFSLSARRSRGARVRLWRRTAGLGR